VFGNGFYVDMQRISRRNSIWKFIVCINIRIHYWIGILSLLITQTQVEWSILYGEEKKEILATGLDQVLGAKGIYLVNGWVITP